MIKKFGDKKPEIHPSVFIAEDATIIGDVVIGENSSIWYGVTIRGDINKIKIGRNTNIQDHTVIHVDRKVEGTEKGMTIIGDGVTIGHRALLHACKIGNNCLIGMGAIILSGAEIGEGSIIGAGALVKENQKIPPKSLVVGLPAVVKGTISDEKLNLIVESAKHYMDLAYQYKKNGY